MKVHGVLEIISGILAIISGVILIFLGLANKVVLATALSSGIGSIVGGIIIIIIGGTFLDDADRLRNLEQNYMSLKSDYEALRRKINK